MEQKRKFASSYLDSIGSGFDAKGYDGPLLGKAETEEVTQGKSWANDKRDAIGRAASLMKRKRLARKLRRIAREIDAMEQAELDGTYEDGIEETQIDAQDQVDVDALGLTPEDMDVVEAQDDDQPEPVEGLVDEDVELSDDEDEDDDNFVEASHPIEHNPSKDNPEANASAQTGDDEWITIGPGSFDDARNEVGKAARKR